MPSLASAPAPVLRPRPGALPDRLVPSRMLPSRPSLTGWVLGPRLPPRGAEAPRPPESGGPTRVPWSSPKPPRREVPPRVELAPRAEPPPAPLALRPPADPPERPEPERLLPPGRADPPLRPEVLRPSLPRPDDRLAPRPDDPFLRSAAMTSSALGDPRTPASRESGGSARTVIWQRMCHSLNGLLCRELRRSDPLVATVTGTASTRPSFGTLVPIPTQPCTHPVADANRSHLPRVPRGGRDARARHRLRRKRGTVARPRRFPHRAVDRAAQERDLSAWTSAARGGRRRVGASPRPPAPGTGVALVRSRAAAARHRASSRHRATPCSAISRSGCTGITSAR